MADGEFELPREPRTARGRLRAAFRDHAPNLRVPASGAYVPTSRMVRFGVVGTVNTALYCGLYVVVRQVCSYLVAHAFAYSTAMLLSFFLHCLVTFRTRPTLRKFLLFPLSNVTGFAVQTVGLSVLVDVVGMNPAYAPLPAMAAAVPVTFLVARLVLLQPRRARHCRGVAALAGTGV
jgi:putative flippase GtrA